MQSKQERKLHKVSPVFILLDNIKKLIFPILIALLGPGGSYWEYIALAIALLVSLGAIVQYRFYRYWLEPNQIRVKEGILFRNERQIPYRRIQNLNLSQNPLHRILGVVTVQLESASGGKPEAVINVVDMAAVKELKQMVHGDSATESESDETAEQTQEQPALLRLPFAEIMRYGMITNKGLVILAVVFGFMSQLGDGAMRRTIETTVIAFADWLSASFDSFVGDLGALTLLVHGLILAVIGLLGLWLLSITFALFKLHDFELLKRKDKLQATMGLLTRMQATIPMSRIQTLTVRNSLLHRWFKRLTLSVETAGGVNHDNQGMAIKEIAPVFVSSDRAVMLEAIQPDVGWGSIEWQPVERAAVKRIMKKLALVSILLATPLAWVHWVWPLPVFVGLVVLGYFYARAYVKNMAYCLDQEVIGFKSGLIFKKETYVRLSKIQTVMVKESLFDRRYGMAKLEVDTAGAMIGAHHVNIPYIALEDALRIQQKLVQRVSDRQFVW